MKINKNTLINSIFYPRKATISMDNKDLLINTEDGNKVGIRMHIANKAYPTILFFHANAELTIEYDDIAAYYNQENINFIVAGYRGYGFSSGMPSKESLLSDSNEIFIYVKKYLKDNKILSKIFLMGRSLGSAAAIQVSNSFQQDISGCIIESGFATEYPLLELLNVDPNLIDYKTSDGFDNLNKISSYTKPLYIIHADLDEIIPLSQAELLFISCKSKIKDLFIVNGANHNNVIYMARQKYFSKIKSFIDLSLS